MAGAALRGLGKALLKKAKSKYPKVKSKGIPSVAGMVARRKDLRGKIPKASDFISRRETLRGVKKKPLISKFEAGVGVGGTGVLATQGYLKFLEAEATKEAKAKETKKEKLKKAIDKKKTEDEKKKKAYGKRAPKKDKNYGGK